MQSHYTINVSKDGHHYFATHERSGIISEKKALDMAADFKTRFPASEGFEVALSRVEVSGFFVNTLRKEG